MSNEPTKADLIRRAEAAGIEGDYVAMTKADLEQALIEKSQEPGTPAHPAIAPESPAASGSEESQPAESKKAKGTVFADDEYSTQQLLDQPTLVVDALDEQLRSGFSPTVLAVALRRADAERVFWTVPDAVSALSDLLMHPVE